MASPGAGKSVIHYKSSDGGSWGAFLQKKLSEPQYAIPTELHEIDSPWLMTTKYDVNIALVSPDFLLLDSFEKFEKCRTGYSLAILLGTSKEEFYGSVSKRNPESRLLKWICYCPEQTRDSVKGLLLTIIHLYENLHGGAEVDDDETCEEDPLFQLVPESSSEDRTSSETEDNYDRLPPTRQVNALNEVIHLSSSEDESRELLILLDRKTDSELELSLESGETISTQEIDQAVYKVKIPKNLIHDGGIKFTAVSNDQILGSMEYIFDNPSRSDPQITESPHDRQHSPSAITNTQKATSTPVSRSASGLDTIRDILEKETDPIYVLCQALRIPETDHEQLDEYLAEKCRRLRITDHFTDLPTKNESDSDRDSEWPTLLHFCADTNLVKSTNELLQVPCLLSACLRCNKNKETPKDIAKRNGFIEIVRLLEKQQSTVLTKDPIMTSLREKNGETDPRNVDSGVSGLHHLSYGGRDSDYMDMTRLSKPPRSIPSSARSSSVTDLRPSGDYGSVVDHPAPRHFMSMSYQEPKTYDRLPDPLSEEGFREGASTFFVKSPPQYKFPSGRRASESDKDAIYSKLNGPKRPKKNSFSKTMSNIFKPKRNNSTISNPESTIPEEKHSGKGQNLPHARGSGFPCTPIESADNDFGDDDTFVSPQPTQIAGNRTSQKDTTLIQKIDEPPGPTKKTFKMMKNPFKKKVDRRKSLRMSRVIKDNDVTVLALPSKTGQNV